MSSGRRHGVSAQFNPMSLYKLIIPLSCLAFIGWIWMTISGA